MSSDNNSTPKFQIRYTNIIITKKSARITESMVDLIKKSIVVALVEAVDGESKSALSKSIYGGGVISEGIFNLLKNEHPLL